MSMKAPYRESLTTIEPGPPLGMLEASGMMLPLWEDALPNVSDDECRTTAERVVARMEA